MTTENQNFTMVRGDTKILIITVTDSNGDPVELVKAGLVFTWGFSQLWADDKGFNPPPIVEKDSDGSDIVLSGNTATITILPADTTTPDPLEGNFHHEAEVNDNGVISTVTVGIMTIDPDLV